MSKSRPMLLRTLGAVAIGLGVLYLVSYILGNGIFLPRSSECGTYSEVDLLGGKTKLWTDCFPVSPLVYLFPLGLFGIGFALGFWVLGKTKNLI